MSEYSSLPYTQLESSNRIIHSVWSYYRVRRVEELVIQVEGYLIIALSVVLPDDQLR